jgi:hypothetical protein
MCPDVWPMKTFCIVFFASDWKVGGFGPSWASPYVVRKRFWINFVFGKQMHFVISGMWHWPLRARMMPAWDTDLRLRCHPLHLVVPLMRLFKRDCFPITKKSINPACSTLV